MQKEIRNESPMADNIRINDDIFSLHIVLTHHG